MLKALVIKELRESAGIIALATFATAIVVTGLTGLPLLPLGNFLSGGFPFVHDVFTICLWLVVGGMAVALGLKQTAWEAAQGTYYFLLHRPVSRPFVFGTKLAIGTSAILALGGLAILIYATWASGAGHAPTPFYWSMTVPAWQTLASLLLVYLGAFMSGVRPARWFGTRLAPLVAGIVTAVLVAFSVWWWLAALLLVVFIAIALSAVFQYIFARDY
jgi:hypothetical protein